MEFYGDSDIDAATSLLIAQLALLDIEDVESSRKGKARADVPIPDEEFAFKLQGESLRLLLGDYAFASSVNRALQTDADELRRLQEVEQAASDDRTAALAASRGQSLPVLTRSQQSLENLPRSGFPISIAKSFSSTTLTPKVEIKVTASSSKAPGASQANGASPLTKECVICKDNVHPVWSFRSACDHNYCNACLISLVEASTRDESLYPLRCCKQLLPVEKLSQRLDRALLLLFRSKATEYDTPSPDRLYCYNGTCSAFLGSTVGAKLVVDCTKCKSCVCTLCKNAAHPGDDCAQNTALAELKALAQNNRWQTCPGCNAIVELQQGCYHMTCRCRAQFCYLCASPWKTCRCDQWDENHLVNAAEQQVNNQFGRRARMEQPMVFQERVRERAADLRHDHFCAHTNWAYRYGGGRCGECNYNLPTYLLRCTGCQTLACVRCTRNRL